MPPRHNYAQSHTLYVVQHQQYPQRRDMPIMTLSLVAWLPLRSLASPAGDEAAAG